MGQCDGDEERRETKEVRAQKREEAKVKREEVARETTPPPVRAHILGGLFVQLWVCTASEFLRWVCTRTDCSVKC
jgi:hypothetical protein